MAIAPAPEAASLPTKLERETLTMPPFVMPIAPPNDVVFTPVLLPNRQTNLGLFPVYALRVIVVYWLGVQLLPSLQADGTATGQVQPLSLWHRLV
jgi:hypothetical protein